MNWKGFGRERFIAQSRHYPAICLEISKTQKTSIRMGRVPAKIRTEHLQNVSLQLYRYTRWRGIERNTVERESTYYHEDGGSKLLRNLGSDLA
jgi:hypothetical protein